MEPTRFCALSVIYEALATDSEKWGDFLANEHSRILAFAKKSDKPYNTTNCLVEITFITERERPFVDKIINILSKEIDSEIPALRHRSLWLLGDWIDHDNKNKYSGILRKMQERINDENWKIRWMANFILGFDYGFSKEEIRISLFDKIRGKYSLIFGNPLSMAEN